jgi:hypothetical protein
MIVVRDQFQGIDAKLPHRIALRGAAATMGIETIVVVIEEGRVDQHRRYRRWGPGRGSSKAKPSLPSIPTVVAPWRPRVSGRRPELTPDG